MRDPEERFDLEKELEYQDYLAEQRKDDDYEAWLDADSKLTANNG